MTDTHPSLATPYRTHTCGQLRADDAGATRAAGGLGPPPARPRPADLPRPARPARDHPGRHRQGRCAGRPRRRPAGSARSSSCPSRATVAARLPGTENPKLPTGAIELQATEVEILSEAKTPPFYINEPDAPVDESLRLKYRYLDIRREPMQRRLMLRSRHGPGHPRGPPRQRLRRGRDADAHQEHARGRPRLHRPEPPPAGDRLRPAAEPAAAQAAADGRRASTATCRSPAATATRTCAATASPSSPSSTSR